MNRPNAKPATEAKLPPKKQELIKLPPEVGDKLTNKRYRVGKFLGRGGFAQCFKLTDIATNEVFAGKVISKRELKTSDLKEKMGQEISIHKCLEHPNIVKFHTFFEDNDYVYIVLELCSRRSLMEMQKRRSTLTEPEVRYIVRQVAQAVHYLHSRRIVHRDLKLGNLFLNEDMEVKVGDFGLATQVANQWERKLTLCGTPNYLAPEVLTKKGHSFEVDVWSLGCIVYILIVGDPPFATDDLKKTYNLIRKNTYKIPPHIPAEVSRFIQKMLRLDPKERPTMEEILNDPYLTQNYIPSRLPYSCLDTLPRFTNGRLSIMPTDLHLSQRRLVLTKNSDNVQRLRKRAANVDTENCPPPISNVVTTATTALKPTTNAVTVATTTPDENPKLAISPPVEAKVDEFTMHPVLLSNDYHLSDLDKQLNNLVTSILPGKDRMHEAEHPESIPFLWISKWVDYTDKYGIGYELCDNSVGILFNDHTRMVLMPDEVNLTYIDLERVEHFHTIDQYPKDLDKKITLLQYFRNYMKEHLLNCGERSLRDGDELARLPYLNKWTRTKNAIAFHLTNGTVQINFFQDHTKLILCPLMSAVTFINEERGFHTYKFSLMKEHGCTRKLLTRLKYARDVVERLSKMKFTTNEKTKPATTAPTAALALAKTANGQGAALQKC